MAGGQLGSIMEQIRRLVGSGPAGDATDGQLLDLFRLNQDETAFTALVQRHGRLVLGVCRRILHDPHEAEDAFQATFFVLARRAKSIRKVELLASWLHGVAVRVAQRSRFQQIRRQNREAQVSTMTGADANQDRQPASREEDVLSVASQREVRSVLDEELARLPDKYRVPMILCYLEGKTNEEAAQQLRWTKGTVSGQIARAREVLRKRLERRGLAIPAIGLVSVLTEQSASAAVSPLLVDAPVTASIQFLTSHVAPGMLSAKATLLAEGVIGSMGWTKPKVAAALLLAAGLVGATAGVIRHQSSASKPAEPAALVERADATIKERPAPNNVDPIRFASAKLVLRVRRQAEAGNRDGFRWQDVTILDIVKNSTTQAFGHRLMVASLVAKHGIPADECTIYLELLNANDPHDQHWKLLGGGAPEGISHVDAVAEKHNKIH